MLILAGLLCLYERVQAASPPMQQPGGVVVLGGLRKVARARFLLRCPAAMTFRGHERVTSAESAAVCNPGGEGCLHAEHAHAAMEAQREPFVRSVGNRAALHDLTRRTCSCCTHHSRCCSYLQFSFVLPFPHAGSSLSRSADGQRASVPARTRSDMQRAVYPSVRHTASAWAKRREFSAHASPSVCCPFT